MAEEEEPSIEEILASIRQIISDDDEEEGGEKGESEAPQEEAVEATPAAEEPEPAPEPEPQPEPEPTPAPVEEDDDDPVVMPDNNMEIPEEEPEPEPEAAEDDVFELTEVVEEGDAEALDQSHDEVDALLNDMGVEMGEKPEIDFEDMDPNAESAPAESEPDAPAEEPEIEAEPEAETVPDMVEPEPVGDVEASDLVGAAAAAASVTGMVRLAENIALARSGQGVTLEDIVSDLLRPMLREWLDENLPGLIERLVREELERLAEKAMKK